MISWDLVAARAARPSGARPGPQASRGVHRRSRAHCAAGGAAAILRERRRPAMATSTRDDDDMISGINVTPLVDVALVLLIVFLVTAKVIASPAMPMALPPATHTTEIKSTLT